LREVGRQIELVLETIYTGRATLACLDVSRYEERSDY